MEGETWSGAVSVPEPRHLLIAVCFGFGFALLRFLLDVFVYEHLSMRLLSDRATSIKTDVMERVEVVKFSESMWKLTYYISALNSGLSEFIDQNHWTADIRQYFDGWPNRELTFYTFLQIGFSLAILEVSFLCYMETHKEWPHAFALSLSLSLSLAWCSLSILGSRRVKYPLTWTLFHQLKFQRGGRRGRRAKEGQFHSSTRRWVPHA
ncbi:unnamed protein product [Spirodela intermedia]|uniref:Uncharacterized protein n=1 Tax=Spirodela intermedia TaxID=51605 RepID=A0A7I8J4H6_SPIIN|nr:unnamed protein product [Spirodela intermedia]CAA6664971.1 unnamed protein product [Spirodela intermedia]